MTSGGLCLVPPPLLDELAARRDPGHQPQRPAEPAEVGEAEAGADHAPGQDDRPAQVVVVLLPLGFHQTG